MRVVGQQRQARFRARAGDDPVVAARFAPAARKIRLDAAVDLEQRRGRTGVDLHAGQDVDAVGRIAGQ